MMIYMLAVAMTVAMLIATGYSLRQEAVKVKVSDRQRGRRIRGFDYRG